MRRVGVGVRTWEEENSSAGVHSLSSQMSFQTGRVTRRDLAGRVWALALTARKLVWLRDKCRCWCPEEDFQ